MASRVYVGNLPPRISEKALEDVFVQFGDVRSVKIIRDPATGRPGRTGLVDMSLEVDAYRAVHVLNGTILAGKKLEVKEA